MHTSDIVQAYRIKLFLNRFAIKSFVLSPDLPKNSFKSLIHYFHIGQYNVLIVLQSGYAMQPELKSVTNVVNFDVPIKYNNYKEQGSRVDQDNGAVLTLVTPANTEEVEAMVVCQRKMQKAFGQANMIKCVPLLWQELMKIKTRVEDVTRSLDNRTVKMEKTNEFKRQLLSNKRLRDYFNEHPEEKEVLVNDLQKNDLTAKNRLLFKHLDFLPFYVLPQQILALTMDQIKLCTTGTQSVGFSSGGHGSVARDRMVTGTLITSEPPKDPMELFADPNVL